MNTTDEESRRIWVEGYIVRDPSRRSSNHRSERSLEENLIESGVVGISGVDTRAITRINRESGAMRAGIFTLHGRERSELIALVTKSPEMSGLNLSDAVSTGEAYVVSATANSIGALAVLDIGVKRATLGHLATGISGHGKP
jgi:carbamoyl-phosphate synthase small subunit